MKPWGADASIVLAPQERQQYSPNVIKWMEQADSLRTRSSHSEAGHSMAIYDPFYAPDDIVLTQTYDFVTATEVVEHLRNPKVDLARIWNCVRPGGVLGIMTKLALDGQAFSTWHYKGDPTHVSFFSRTTFEWLALQWNARLTFVRADVMIFEQTY